MRKGRFVPNLPLRIVQFVPNRGKVLVFIGGQPH